MAMVLFVRTALVDLPVFAEMGSKRKLAYQKNLKQYRLIEMQLEKSLIASILMNVSINMSVRKKQNVKILKEVILVSVSTVSKETTVPTSMSVTAQLVAM